MSDCYTDVVYQLQGAFDRFFALLFAYHLELCQRPTNWDQLIKELNKNRQEFHLIDKRFICSELGLLKHPENQAADWIMNYKTNFIIPTLEQLMFLLLLKGQTTKLIQLQKASRYNNKLLIFVGPKSRIMSNGVHYQNSFWKVMDGDQDILLGNAKKRCYKEPFTNQYVVLVSEKHRYRKQYFILKEVIRL